MKIIVIPDVHLKPWMFQRASEIMAEKKLDGVVCLMDLPDDWGHARDLDLYTETYDAAIRFVQTHSETLWCWGNHDLSYKWGLDQSGYSSMAQGVVRGMQGGMADVLPRGNATRYVQRIDSVLFSHAGLSASYARDGAPSIKGDDVDGVLERVNSRGARYLWNDGSPIWLRPQPQYNPTKLFQEKTMLQVVGHTPVERIERTGNLISCDVFSTYPDGTPIGTQEFLVLDTVSWDFDGVR
jgi:hypothetical protein